MTIEEKEKKFRELYYEYTLYEEDGTLRTFKEALKSDIYESYLDYSIKYLQGDESVLDSISNNLIRFNIESLKILKQK